MTEREEIDFLRREVADLRDRLRTLEARPVSPVFVPSFPLSPLSPTVVPQPQPQPYISPYATTTLRPINETVSATTSATDLFYNGVPFSGPVQH